MQGFSKEAKTKSSFPRRGCIMSTRNTLVPFEARPQKKHLFYFKSNKKNLRYFTDVQTTAVTLLKSDPVESANAEVKPR